MRKKGQIGQIITSVPVLFLIAFLMILFIVLTFWFAVSLDPPENVVAGSSDALMNSFLFQDLKLNGEDEFFVSIIMQWVEGTLPRTEGINSVAYSFIKLLEGQIGSSSYRGTSQADSYVSGAFARGSGTQRYSFYQPEADCVGVSYSADGRDYLWRTAAGIDYKTVMVEIKKKLFDDSSTPPEAKWTTAMPENVDLNEFVFVKNGKKYIAQYYYGKCYGGENE